MPLKLQTPIWYAISSGLTTSKTTPDDPEFAFILHLIKTAVFSEVPLFQIREKNLPARRLFELASRAAEITRGSSTRLLVNDRFDVARAAGADGVHLSESSLPPRVVRETCGEEFLIGASTHSLESARAARNGGADFVVFGPVFETESKRAFGPPQGLEKLREVATALQGFPVLAIGGVTIDNAASCFAAGASGAAGISWFNASHR
ncbi:MAG TPA: thiamine phosphate synthase [Pyrinomonadaceae bacterium]|nr:thiamine phosphate synthase [Pyrinomonadaceae bacterium]